MSLTKKFLTLLCLVSFTANSASAISNKGFRADMSFADFEELSSLFKPHHKQSVFKINHDDSPIKILRAGVRDQGTVFFKGLSGARNTYRIEVENLSGREILAYQVTWILKHPFEDYVFHKIKVNSIKPLAAGEKQKLQFRRNKHYRDDAYYYVEISKVEFSDSDSIWEAPEIEKYKTHTRMDEVKRQIDEMEEDKGLEALSDEEIEVLKQKYSQPQGDGLEGPRVIEFDNTKNMVELEEIKESSEDEASSTTTTTTTETTTQTKTVETQESVVETPEEVIETTTEEVVEKEIIIEEDGYTLESEQAELNIDEDDFEDLLKDVDALLKRNKDGIVEVESTNMIIEEEPIIIEDKLEEPAPAAVTTVEETVIETPAAATTVVEETVIEETVNPEETVTQTTTTTTERSTSIEEDDSAEDSEDEDFDDEDWDEDDDFDFDDEIDFGDDDDFDDF